MNEIKHTTTSLTYRLYEKDDIEGILELWEKHSGWGALTPQQFRDWFIDTPYGNCLIVVAIDEDNKIKGQLILSPSRMVVEGQIIKTLRGAAPILDPSLRQSTLRSVAHPTFALFENAFIIAAEKGYEFIYSFPAYGWINILKLIPHYLHYPTEVDSYDCFAVSLNKELKSSLLNTEYSVSKINCFSEEHEMLWNEMVLQFPINCAVQRDWKWMNWKSGQYLKLETRSLLSNKLLGFCIIRKDGLINDLVARNTADLKTVFTQSLCALHVTNANRLNVSFEEIKGMLTTEMQIVLQDIHYRKDDYCFAFSGHLLNQSFDFEKLKMTQWYMTPLG